MMVDCDLENNLITKADFEFIGQVAKHCNWEQLTIYIREQTNLWLIPKIGYSLVNLIAKNPDNELLTKIWCGAEYVCGGKSKVHFGLKRVLVHASYGAYIFRHGYTDTASGVVQKINQDSMPAPINELKSIMNEHYRNAEIYLEMTKDYICSIKNEEIIKNSIQIYCKDCGCEQYNGTAAVQTRGLFGGNIRKWD